MSKHSEEVKPFVSLPLAIFITIVLFGLVVIGLGIMTYSDSEKQSTAQSAVQQDWPLCANHKNLIRANDGITELEIKAECWSATIQLPPQKNFRIDAPGELEIRFWNGVRIFTTDQNSNWVGQIPASVFRLRGTPGTAKIYVYVYSK